MKAISPALVLALTAVFAGGFVSHVLYQRWNPAAPRDHVQQPGGNASQVPGGQPHAVIYVPLSRAAQSPADLPVVEARDIDKIRALSGRRARVRGRIFRVGHSVKSNTHFLNFGPDRGALTGVVFASALELFERRGLSPKTLQGKEVEIAGEVKDHPQYGLEVILETPEQVKVID